MTTSLTLNTGASLPQLGLGVWQATPDEAATAVATALRLGYRLIDTAAAYGNEDGVGRGIAESGVDRAEVFVTTKLWLTDYDDALRGFDRSLAHLGLDYLDLYLLHWPAPAMGEVVFGAYRALEKLHADGRIRAIGVCNYQPDQLAQLIDATQIVPAVNQIELHPYFIQRDLRAANAEHGVLTQSWAPIGGSGGNGGRVGDGRRVLNEPLLAEIGAKYGKTPAQVVLRWHVQHGLSAIPKSANPGRIAQNIDIFDFELTDADVTAIDGLHTGQRGGNDPREVTFDTWDITLR